MISHAALTWTYQLGRLTYKAYATPAGEVLIYIINNYRSGVLNSSG
jgi:hypothetical protein